MKLRGLTIPNALACLLLAAAWTLIRDPWAPSRPGPLAFEVRLESDQSGLAQLYYDAGRGINESDSAIEPIVAGSAALLRFRLPFGRITGLRFDPIDRDAHLVISDARIVDAGGRTVRSFGPASFGSPHEIDSMAADGGALRIATSPRSTDCYLSVDPNGPIVAPRPSFLRDLAPAFLGVLAVVVAFLWAWDANFAGMRAGLARSAGWARRAPFRCVAAVSLAATLAANFPVAFLGRSFVSPNLGVALLYGQPPWLPGRQSGEEGDPHKADVAALLWHHLPLSMLEHRAVEAGELPLWNRYDSAGLPLLGQGQSAFTDPLNWLPVEADGAAWAWDVKFLAAKWLLAIGSGFCAFLLFRHLPAALLIAASSPFLGFFVYRINHPAIFSLCYAPWILVAWHFCCGASSRRAAVLAFAGLIAANWMEMSSGTAKEAYVLLLSLNFAGVCLLLFSRRTLSQKAALLCGAAAAGILFAALSAPLWVTFSRALKASYTSYNSPQAFQIQPGMLLGLFDEAFYRPFQVDSGVINPSANVFILLGVLWACVLWRETLADRAGAALAAACVPVGAIVYGVVPPSFIDRVPVLANVLHVDNSFSCVLVVLLSLLAALGWRGAWARLAARDGLRDAGRVMVLLILVFAVYLGTAQSVVRGAYAAYSWGRIAPISPFLYGYGASLLVGAWILMASLRRMRVCGRATAAALLCAATALAAFHWREALRTGSGYAAYVVKPGPRPVLSAPSPAIEAIKADPDPSRVVGFHNDLLPGWSIVYGVEGISGPDALMNPYYRELLDTAGITRIWDWRYIIEPSETARLRPILDLLGVRYYVGYHLGSARPGGGLEPAGSADMEWFRSAGAWPRAFYTDAAAVYSDVGQYWSWVKAGDGRPFAGISRADWAALKPAPRVSGNLAGRAVVPASDFRLTPDSTEFTVDAPRAGLVVLTEAFEAGNFRAYLNGRRVPYFRANHAFKAVYVEQPGTYEVRFVYWPEGLTGALEASLGAAIALCAALAWAFFGRRRPARA